MHYTLSLRPARRWLGVALAALFAACGDSPSVVGSAVGLRFDAIVQSTTAGAQIPAVSVSVVDAIGSVVSSATPSITIQAVIGGAAGAISGTLTKTAVSGTAVFNDLSIQQAGSYSLVASAPGLAAASSNMFTIAP